VDDREAGATSDRITPTMYNLGGRVTNAELIRAACHDIPSHHATLPEVGAALSDIIAAYRWQITPSWVNSQAGLNSGAACP
jgi:hypothetical protein